MPSILRKNLARDYALTLSWRYAEVEFLGLPKLKDERVFRLEHIYVPLRLCRNLADRFAEEKTFYVPKALQEARRLVVLGDPGSGKSTLVKVLTYAFGEADSNAYKRACGELIPIPIILRNYKTRQWSDYNDMLDDFITTLDEDIRNQITAEWLLDYMREGKAILFVDGLDEVGSGEDRKHLRDKVVRPLLRDTPNSYAVLTSRIVGYDEVPFEGYVDLTKYSDDDPYRWASLSINRLYVAPFNDDEILQFITRWYQLRESLPDKQREGVDSLMSALNQNDRVKRLAHNPQLLTLIALIHRVTANLPSGRVELYDKIVEAYLETIQVYRKLGTPAKLDEMKRWLAKVGWEMQVRREEEIKKSPGSKSDDLLVSREEIRQWLIEAIARERGGAEAPEIADHFLDYVAKRSGLLVPRGPEEFAFAHLTFQEYFAAFELRGRVRRFDDLAATCAKLVTKRLWHETLNVMFEMLTEFHGACDDLFDLMVKEADDQISTAEFFSALLLDEQNGLSPAKQEQAAQFALAQTCHRFNDSIISNLRQLAPSQFASWVAQPMMQQLQTAQPEALEPDFFFVGRVLLDDWSQLLSKMIDKRGVLNWNENQVAAMTMIGGGNANVLEWAAERLPLRVWLAPISLNSGTGKDLCLAEANINQILNAHMRSPRCYLLAQSAFALAGSEIQALRIRIMILAGAPKIDSSRYLDISLDKNIPLDILPLIPTSINSSKHIHRAVARLVARYMIRYLDTAYSLNPYIAELLSVAIGSSRLDQIDNWDELISIGCDVEWLTFQLNREKEQASTVARLRKFLSADDDWTRLQAINNLITLNVGTPELCAERNRLLDLALEEPGKFTFPHALREVTKSRDFITKEFPEAIRIIFLHKPGDSLLKPEWFDRNSEESRFFLSPPSEFFALAAKVLDPDGKTELVKKLKL